MKLMNIAMSAAAIAALTLPVLAGGIHAKAASTSHHLQEVSTEMHTYTHHNYPGSFGSHGMETAAVAAHSTLHDYGHGTATVQEVLDAVDACNAAFDDMSAQLDDAGLLSGPDQDKQVKQIYHDIHKTLAKLNAYVASA